MEKFWDLYKKFSNMVVAGAAAYWLLVGLIGDILAIVFFQLHLGILIRLFYIAVGGVGALKLIEMLRPDLFAKIQNKKPTTKK